MKSLCRQFDRRSAEMFARVKYGNDPLHEETDAAGARRRRIHRGPVDNCAR